MGAYPLLLMTLGNLLVSGDLVYRSEYAGALIFFAYALSSVGLLWKFYGG